MSTSKSKTNVAGDAATAKIAGVTEQVQDTISDHAETAQLHVMKLGDQITKFMRKQPVASFGLAVGIGALIGVLEARR